MQKFSEQRKRSRKYAFRSNRDRIFNDLASGLSRMDIWHSLRGLEMSYSQFCRLIAAEGRYGRMTRHATVPKTPKPQTQPTEHRNELLQSGTEHNHADEEFKPTKRTRDDEARLFGDKTKDS